MAHFEILLEQVQPFGRVDCPVDVRVTGTYRDVDNWEIDYVEVPGRDRQWESISRLHPLWNGWDMTGGIGGVVHNQDTTDLIEAAIRKDMEDDAPRQFFVIYRHQQAAE